MLHLIAPALALAVPIGVAPRAAIGAAVAVALGVAVQVATGKAAELHWVHRTHLAIPIALEEQEEADKLKKKTPRLIGSIPGFPLADKRFS